MPSVLRHRDFTLLWAGLTVSELGNTVTFLAFPLVAVLALGASPLLVGVVGAAGSVAWLVVGLPAGVWVDRLRRRRVMIASDLARAVLLLSVPVAWWLGILTIAQLAVVALLAGVGEVLFSLANTAFLPRVLPADRLADGNSVLQASFSGAAIAGPGLGGGLVQLLGAPATLLVDAVSFLVSAVSVGAMRTREEAPARPEQRRRLRSELREGMSYMVRTPLPRTLALTATLCNLALSGYDVVIILFAVRDLHLAAGVIGLVFGAGSIGGLVGSALAGRVVRRVGDARAILLAALGVVFGLLTPLATRGLGLAWLIAGSVGATASIGVYNVCVLSAMQTTVPSALLGRVAASVRVFTRGVMPVGALLGGALAGWLPERAALAIVVALLLGVPVLAWSSPLARVRSTAELRQGGSAQLREDGSAQVGGSVEVEDGAAGPLRAG
jgi:MFS family permease